MLKTIFYCKWDIKKIFRNEAVKEYMMIVGYIKKGWKYDCLNTYNDKIMFGEKEDVKMKMGLSEFLISQL